MKTRNEREANFAVGTCPPCTGACRQGRDCPAPREDHSLGWLGLVCIIAPWAVGALLLWVWRTFA